MFNWRIPITVTLNGTKGFNNLICSIWRIKWLLAQIEVEDIRTPIPPTSFECVFRVHFHDVKFRCLFIWALLKIARDQTLWFTCPYQVNRPVLISSRLPNIPLFELSRSQIIQLICVFISPKLQLAGYLVEIIIPRYLGLVCKISPLFVRCVLTSSPKTRTMCERWAKYLKFEFQALSQVSSCVKMHDL